MIQRPPSGHKNVEFFSPLSSNVKCALSSLFSFISSYRRRWKQNPEWEGGRKWKLETKHVLKWPILSTQELNRCNTLSDPLQHKARQTALCLAGHRSAVLLSHASWVCVRCRKAWSAQGRRQLCSRGTVAHCSVHGVTRSRLTAWPLCSWAAPQLTRGAACVYQQCPEPRTIICYGGTAALCSRAGGIHPMACGKSAGCVRGK